MEAAQMLLMDGLTKDQKAMVMMDYREKSVGLAYLFWFILGIHYGYIGKWGTQIIYWITLGGIGIWAFIDLFRMSGVVNKANTAKLNDSIAKAKMMS